MTKGRSEFCFKLHNAGGKSILAACDTELMGKTIKHRDFDFEISDSFYGKECTCEEKILEDIKKASIVNVVGKKIVELLVKNDLVDEECVLWLDNVPHVQIVKI